MHSTETSRCRDRGILQHLPIESLAEQLHGAVCAGLTSRCLPQQASGAPGGKGKALKCTPVNKPCFGDACQRRASPVELERVPVKRLRSVFEADKSLPLKCGRRAKAPSSCSCCQPLRINHSRVQIRAQSGAEHFSCQEEGSAGYRSAPSSALGAWGGRAPLRSCLFPLGGGLMSCPHARAWVAPARPCVTTSVRPLQVLHPAALHRPRGAPAAAR